MNLLLIVSLLYSADNVTADSGSGGATFATDEISNVHYPRTKLIHGVDGVNDGDVSTVNPLPVDIVTDQPLDRLTDNVGVAIQTDVLLDDTIALTPKFAAIAASLSGNNTLVAAVAGKKIRVLEINFVCAAAVTVRIEDGAGGSALTGQQEFAANSGISLPYFPVGLYETTANTILNMELSGAVSVAGSLVYVEV